MKLITRTISPVLALLLFSACATNKIAYRTPPQEDWRNQRPPAGPAVETKLPLFEQHRLSNGMQVILVKENKLPIVAIEVLIKAGSSSESAAQAGLAGMLVDMLTKGTKTLNADEFSESLSDIGTSVSSSCDQDAASLSLGVLAQHTRPALGLIADALQNPSLEQEEFERLQRLRLASLEKRKGNPRAVGKDVFYERVYGADHPYGHPVSGTLTSVKALKRKHLKKFYQRNYGPATTTVIVTGDIQTENMLGQLEKTLGQWKSKANLPATPPDVEPAEQLTVYVIPRPDAPQSFMMAGRPLIRKGDPDEYKLKVMNAGFGGLFSSRLNMKLREEKQYTYGARSSVNPLRGQGVLVAGGMIKGEHTVDALQETFIIMNDISQNGITPEEMQFAKDALIKPLPSYFETVGALASAAGILATYDLPMNQFELVMKQINDVELQHVSQLSKDALNIQNYTVVLVGDPKWLDEKLKTLSDANVIRLDENGRDL
ncbi:MAG: hypothetical protein CMH56_11510 [Myxococcales bacterium]|nr:hypothetical protein [Myxococcales bacterium]|tara:strand:+ start:579 stop:2042 length:1464 start_codon:yes stop_codon:yes gene_type:complete